MPNATNGGANLVLALELQIQPLYHLMHEETQMLRAQHLLHIRPYQIPLLRAVTQKSRHACLSLISPVDCKYSHRL